MWLAQSPQRKRDAKKAPNSPTSTVNEIPHARGGDQEGWQCHLRAQDDPLKFQCPMGGSLNWGLALVNLDPWILFV
jgi:hypothetical protein